MYLRKTKGIPPRIAFLPSNDANLLKIEDKICIDYYYYYGFIVYAIYRIYFKQIYLKNHNNLFILCIKFIKSI